MIVAEQPHLRFGRAHFKSYGESALLFEVVYYVTNPDYELYMDAQQAINLAIHRRFSREHIEFAYPTHTVHLAGAGVHLSLTESRNQGSVRPLGGPKREDGDSSKRHAG